MNALLHQLAIVFGWPGGIVTGNLLAEAMVVTGAVVFRDRLGRAFAAWHHKHHMAHLARLGLSPSATTPQDPKGPQG
jgi:hypothetical protein